VEDLITRPGRRVTSSSYENWNNESLQQSNKRQKLQLQHLKQKNESEKKKGSKGQRRQPVDTIYESTLG